MADQISTRLRLSGVTHETLAQALGMSRPAISDRMRGRTRWTLLEAIEIARLMGITLDALAGDNDLDVDYTLTEPEHAA